MTTDTPDPTNQPNKPPESQVPAQPIVPPAQIPAQIVGPFMLHIPLQTPVPQPQQAADPTTPTQVPVPPAETPQHRIPGVMGHPDMDNMVEVSAHAGIVQILIRPSGAWMRVPCHWIPQLIARIEVARDAAALMQSAIEMGTGQNPLKRP